MPSCCSANGIECQRWRLSLRRLPPLVPSSALRSIPGRGAEPSARKAVARYITRPPVAIERLSLMPQGHIKYSLKTPYRDGTTHVIFEPLDFMARLASLAPSPRVNLTRYHGNFAPHHRLRAQIVPSARSGTRDSCSLIAICTL
jgi:Putative transposase